MSHLTHSCSFFCVFVSCLDGNISNRSGLMPNEQSWANSKPVCGLCSVKRSSEKGDRREGGSGETAWSALSQQERDQGQRSSSSLWKSRTRENVESSAHSAEKPVARPTPAPKFRHDCMWAVCARITLNHPVCQTQNNHRDCASQTSRSPKRCRRIFYAVSLRQNWQTKSWKTSLGTTIWETTEN